MFSFFLSDSKGFYTAIPEVPEPRMENSAQQEPTVNGMLPNGEGGCAAMNGTAEDSSRNSPGKKKRLPSQKDEESNAGKVKDFAGHNIDKSVPESEVWNTSAEKGSSTNKLLEESLQSKRKLTEEEEMSTADADSAPLQCVVETNGEVTQPKERPGERKSPKNQTEFFSEKNGLHNDIPTSTMLEPFVHKEKPGAETGKDVLHDLSSKEAQENLAKENPSPKTTNMVREERTTSSATLPEKAGKQSTEFPPQLHGRENGAKPELVRVTETYQDVPKSTVIVLDQDLWVSQDKEMQDARRNRKSNKRRTKTDNVRGKILDDNKKPNRVAHEPKQASRTTEIASNHNETDDTGKDTDASVTQAKPSNPEEFQRKEVDKVPPLPEGLAPVSQEVVGQTPQSPQSTVQLKNPEEVPPPIVTSVPVSGKVASQSQRSPRAHHDDSPCCTQEVELSSSTAPDPRKGKVKKSKSFVTRGMSKVFKRKRRREASSSEAELEVKSDTKRREPESLHSLEKASTCEEKEAASLQQPKKGSDGKTKHKGGFFSRIRRR